MSKTWRLKRVTQCAKCPWRKDVDPYDIPNGYDVKKHENLKNTIAKPGDHGDIIRGGMRVMACHETKDAHCVGWLENQLGVGNNLALRFQMLSCANANRIRTIGEQHERFEDTIPKVRRRGGKSR